MRWIVAAVLGWLGFLVLGVVFLVDRHTATPDAVEGWAMPNAQGTAISLHDSTDDRPGNGYVIAGARWAGPDGVWRDDAVSCVGTDTTVRTRVRLGIVDVVPGDAPGGPHVVWLRCLT
jgi:hypothetical protein